MNQKCKVCGEPAAGFHFGAFTCEGCKVILLDFSFFLSCPIVYVDDKFKTSVTKKKKKMRAETSARITGFFFFIHPLCIVETSPHTMALSVLLLLLLLVLDYIKKKKREKNPVSFFSFSRPGRERPPVPIRLRSIPFLLLLLLLLL